MKKLEVLVLLAFAALIFPAGSAPSDAGELTIHLNLEYPRAVTFWVNDETNYGVPAEALIFAPSSTSGSHALTDSNGLLRMNFTETGNYTIVFSPLRNISGRLRSDVRMGEIEKPGGSPASHTAAPVQSNPFSADFSQVEIPEWAYWALAVSTVFVLLIVGAIFYLALFSRRPPE